MNECSCIYDGGDHDPPEFYREKMSKARKVHICNECQRNIIPGERYEVVVGNWGNGLDTYKTCLDCMSIRDVLFCEGWAFGMVWENIYEYVWDTDGDLLNDSIKTITPAARNKLFTIIEDMWADREAEGYYE